MATSFRDGPLIREIFIGRDSEPVRILNEAGTRLNHLVICHLHPSPDTSAPHDILRALGKNSRAIGWPKNKTDAWENAEVWLEGEGVQHLVFYPAENLTSWDLKRIRTLRSDVDVVWLAYREMRKGFQRVSKLDLSEALQAQSASFRTKMAEAETLLSHAPTKDPLLSRYQALKELQPDDYLVFGFLWDHARAQTETRIGHEIAFDPERWARIVSVDHAGEVCVPRLAGARSALLTHGIGSPVESEMRGSFEPTSDSKGQSPRLTCSAEIGAVSALRRLGFGPLEVASVSMCQISRSTSGTVSVYGEPIPSDEGKAIFAQYRLRKRWGVGSFLPLIPGSPLQVDQERIEESYYWGLGAEEFETVHTTSDVWLPTPGRELALLSELLKMPRGDQMDADSIRIPPKRLQALIDRQVVAKRGTFLAATDEFRFSCGVTTSPKIENEDREKWESRSVLRRLSNTE